MATIFSGEQAIEALYIGYFGRAGDPVGASYWLEQLNSGLTIAQMAASFAVQKEATSLYGYLASPGIGGTAAINNFIAEVYQDLFNRGPDSAGQTYWAGQLQAANGSPQAIAQFILNMISGALGTDQTTIQNKVTVAESFSDSLAIANGQYTAQADSIAHSVVKNTTSDSASVATQEAAVTAFISAQATATTPVALTIGTDTISGANVAISGVVDTSGNQTTLNVGDLLNPAGTNNSLTVTQVSGAAINSANVPVLNNVQTYLETNVSSAGVVTVDFTGIAPALTTIGVTGGNQQTTFEGFDGTQVQTLQITNYNPSTIAGTLLEPNPGLTSAGSADGTLTINVANDSGNAGAGTASVLIIGAAADDGYSAITVNSKGPVTNDLAGLLSTGALVSAVLKTLTITGSAALKIDTLLSFDSGVVNIQAGTDTGGLDLDVHTQTGKVTFVGGTAGVERLQIDEASLVASGTSIMGGAGASDTLIVPFAANPTSAEYAALNTIAGFEILGLNTNVTVDDSQLTGPLGKHFALSGAATGVTISNMYDNATVDVLVGGGDLLGPSVGAHTITVNVGVTTSTGLNTLFQATGWSTVNVSSNGTGPNSIAFFTPGNTTFNLMGSAAASVGVTGSTTANAWNASTFTGKLTFNDSGQGDVISTGSGATTIIESSPSVKGDAITLLPGHTTVDNITSNAAVFSAATPALIETVKNFVLNQDTLTNTAGALTQGSELGATAGTGIITSGAFAAAANFETAVKALAGSAKDAVAWSDGTNTFVAEFNGTAGQAHVVELVGLTGATAIGTTTGAGHILVA